MYNRWAKTGHHTLVSPELDLPPNIPCTRLLQAVTLRAIRDFYSTDRDVQRSASQWLFKQSEQAPPWSFNWVCAILGRCPKEAQRKIRSFRPEPDGSQIKGIRFKLRGSEAGSGTTFSSG
jgi:hypothetical protein